MIILDTNVLSELLRPEPARQVERWLSAQENQALKQAPQARVSMKC
jgi:predicted nucleic acid-binding protein